jgi:hypothetical protein
MLEFLATATKNPVRIRDTLVIRPPLPMCHGPQCYAKDETIFAPLILSSESQGNFSLRDAPEVALRACSCSRTEICGLRTSGHRPGRTLASLPRQGHPRSSGLGLREGSNRWGSRAPSVFSNGAFLPDTEQIGMRERARAQEIKLRTAQGRCAKPCKLSSPFGLRAFVESRWPVHVILLGVLTLRFALNFSRSDVRMRVSSLARGRAAGVQAPPSFVAVAPARLPRCTRGTNPQRQPRCLAELARPF